MTQVVDYVIVGAGSAGCVLANRLSEGGKYTVCLLEAGPPDKSIWIHLPIGYGKTMFSDKVNWRFYTEPEPNMAGREIYWPRGKTLGGSSSINGLIYVRGQKEDYDHWKALGNDKWGWADCLPYFRKLEDNDLGESETRGVGGPLTVSSIPVRHELVEAFIATGNKFGLNRLEDFNTGDQEGVGYYQLTTRNGKRCSTAVAYLKPAKSRNNLEIKTHAQVTKVLFENRKAIGVEYLQHGQLRTLKANKEVVLSAGAIQSPQLLQLSGLGDANFLNKFEIPVVQNLPGVGENLQDHLQIRLIYKVSKPITTNDQLRSLIGRMNMGLQWLIKRGGPLAIGINQGAMFCRVLPDAKTPDIQFHLGTLSADMAGSKVHDFPGCTYSVCQLRPQSRGFVKIKSTDSLIPPAMQPNYLTSEYDQKVAISAVRFARQMAATEPLKSLMEKEYRPGKETQSDEEILQYCREYGETIFHPTGTAKMGPKSDKAAVVDQELKVYGVQGLRVVDGSVMPTIVSGNTNAPIIMIAERAAEFILNDAKQ